MAGVPALDGDFRSDDFFATARFPTAMFQSIKVERGAAANRLKVTGDLSLHGVTKPVILDGRRQSLCRREMALPTACGNIWPRHAGSECEQP